MGNVTRIAFLAASSAGWAWATPILFGNLTVSRSGDRIVGDWQMDGIGVQPLVGHVPFSLGGSINWLAPSGGPVVFPVGLAFAAGSSVDMGGFIAGPALASATGWVDGFGERTYPLFDDPRGSFGSAFDFTAAGWATPGVVAVPFTMEGHLASGVVHARPPQILFNFAVSGGGVAYATFDSALPGTVRLSEITYAFNVPEPSSWTVALLGLAALCLYWRRVRTVAAAPNGSPRVRPGGDGPDRATLKRVALGLRC